ncbi:AmiS/UreI family transporter [Desulfospira joergensenii]|uniref:AmiS/UreI family transporter n=1 Tax=Desulfospira joergensenii TaxID=53329 RepID=UPI0003B7A383|nr:AmiS/UreI family transporter [Desulfospira joergensenii]
MVEPILMAISLMWFPVGLLLLGKGEPKGTGALVLMVGTLVLISAVIQAAVFKDPYLAALLFAYGLFYCIVGYSLFAGLPNMQAAGNASFTLIPITLVYMILALTGGPVLEGGKQLVGKSDFLALACAGYAVLYIMVWLNAYEKLSSKTLGLSLLVWTVVGLWVPSFWLLTAGKLPF